MPTTAPPVEKPESDSLLRAKFPPGWNVSQVGELETRLPGSYEKLARMRLTRLGNEYPQLWARGGLGDAVAIRQVRALHLWTVGRVVVTEERTVADHLKPYRNERLGRQTIVDSDGVDAASVSLFAGDHDVGEDHLDIEESARVVTCLQCSRGGKVPCPECDGTGGSSCGDCHGTGRRSCSCLGGEVMGVRGPKQCPECRGRGTVTCTECRGGTVPCEDCLGKGAVDCPACNGQKQAIQILRVSAKRRRKDNLFELNDEALEPLLNVLRINELKGTLVPPDWNTIQAEVRSLSDSEALELGNSTGAAILYNAAENSQRAGTLHHSWNWDSDRYAMLSDVRNEAASLLETRVGLVAKRASFEVPGTDLISISGHGLPLPPFLPSVEVPKSHQLGLPEDYARHDIDFDAFASSLFAGQALRGVGPELVTRDRIPTDGLSPRFQKAMEVLARTNVRVEGNVVRDYLVVFVRSWIAVDISLGEKTYRAFLGKDGVHFPSGSPLKDESTRLVEYAESLLFEKNQAKQVAIVRDCLERALELPAAYPSREALASFLWALPKGAVPVDEAKQMVSTVRVKVNLIPSQRMEALNCILGEIPGDTTFDAEEWGGRSGKLRVNPVTIDANVLEGSVFVSDLGMVNGAALDAVNASLDRKQARQSLMLIMVFLAAAVILAVGGLVWAFWAAPTSREPVPFPTIRGFNAAPPSSERVVNPAEDREVDH